MTARQLSQVDIEACLGPVSQDLVRRILESGATIEELGRAVYVLGLGMQHRQAGRIRDLCLLLEEALGAELWSEL